MQVQIISCWWKDNYERCTRSIKWSEKEICSFENQSLTEKLVSHFNKVLSWATDDLVEDAFKHEAWKNLGRTELEKNETKYPFPKIE